MNNTKKRISRTNYEQMVNSMKKEGFSTQQITDVMKTFSKHDLLAGEQEKRRWKFENSDIYVVKPSLSYSLHKTGDNTKPENYYKFKEWIDEQVEPIFEKGRSLFMVEV